MKLTAKLVLVLMLGVICVNTVKGYLDIRYQDGVFRQLARQEAETIGDAMEEMVVVAFGQGEQAGVLELINKASGEEHQMELRWVWFDAPPGDPYCPATPRSRLVEATLREHLPVEARHADGASYLHVYWPVEVGGSRKGALELYKPMSELALLKRTDIYRKLLQTVATILVAGLVVVVMGVGVVGRPLERLMEKIRRIGRGDLSGPIQMRSRDELAELAEHLNRMCRQLARSQTEIREEATARIAAVEQLRHVDRLRTVGRLASGMAHEMGTPLNVVSGRAELIASGKLSDAEIVDSAKAIKAEADKMTGIIRQLLDFARRTTPQRVSVDLQQVVRQTLELLGALAEKQGVDLSLAEGAQSLITMIDVGQIQQVLMNVILNAIQAMPDGGRVELHVSREHARPPEGQEGREGDYCRISVRDQGQGVSAEDMEHLFEPFHTTKDVGEGTGLGLSISYGIVREHGGWIEATSQPGKGSCFSIYLPQGTEQ
ncbi:MAG: sensor histidine kinase [Planctomycetota bacterium]|jgi:signal transduction histidine kinase